LSERATDRTSPSTVTPWRVACLIGIASLWGLAEILVDSTVAVTAAALMLLALGRAVLNLPGSSVAMAGVAVLFRWTNAAPFYCHLAGIALLGVAFDLVASVLIRTGGRPVLRGALTGAGAAYLGAFLFASSMAWLLEVRHWPEPGKVASHVLHGGSLAALAGVVAVPVGLALGRALADVADRHPRRLLAAAASASVMIWGWGAAV
jgi:hypothetical protein